MFSIAILFSACTKVDELILITDKTTKEEDVATLENLLTEIKEIAESEACENANKWEFTAIGKKACGGPTGYIAYSEKIDKGEFLELVDTYTKAMNDFNMKWDIFSDCIVTPKPKNVSCKDGKAILNY